MTFTIGKTVEVIDSTNTQLIGITGTIIDETKETFVIETQRIDGSHIEKIILKNGSTFRIGTNGSTHSIIVVGSEYLKRPEDTP